MAAPVRVLAVSPATQKVGRACGMRRPDEVFSRDGPLGARSDVRVLTSDGQELWLHRVVLEMWSRLFHDLIAAQEEVMDPTASLSQSPSVTITVTDTASDLMLLLSCLYPARHHTSRKQASVLDAASFLPLLGLADKYHCLNIIDRCAAFAVEHIIPRLAAQPCSSTAAAGEYLQISPSAAENLSAAVLEWVVRCLELAVRLDLKELTESTASLLGRRFFDWDLQNVVNSELVVRVARVLSVEEFVRLVLQAIPTPSMTRTGTGMADTCGRAAAASGGSGGGGGGAAAVAVVDGWRNVPRNEPLAAAGGGGGGGGPRIVPVVVAAAGPAAVALQQVAAAAPPPPALNLHVPAGLGNPPPPHPPPQPFAAPPNLGWPPQPHQQPQQFFVAGAGGPEPVAAGLFGGGAVNGAAAGLANQPEPLLGPAHHHHHHHGW